MKFTFQSNCLSKVHFIKTSPLSSVKLFSSTRAFPKQNQSGALHPHLIIHLLAATEGGTSRVPLMLNSFPHQLAAALHKEGVSEGR